MTDARRALVAHDPSVMRFTLPLALITILAGACGKEEQPRPTPPAPTTTKCGKVGPLAGNECNSLDDCGDANNHITNSDCEHCLSRSDQQLCEAGVCRDLAADAMLKVYVDLPEEARGAKTFTVATVNPIMADGATVTCAALLSTCDYAHNGKINTGNSSFVRFTTPGGADPSLAYTPKLISVDVGADRLVVVFVASEEQGGGTVMTQGCVDGISVAAGEVKDVVVMTAAP